MKLKDGFLLKEIAGSWVVVPVGEQVVDFQMMITLNETGAFLWEKLKSKISKEELLNALLSEYAVERSVAEADVDEFLKTLSEKELLEAE
ncbi:MAG: PqqD family protein [Clostridia bacterium]|nr:PqqD family protein [Clostridia bacterium]